MAAERIGAVSAACEFRENEWFGRGRGPSPRTGQFLGRTGSGPWASTIVSDPDFAANFAIQDQDRYLAVVGLMGQMLFDRDTTTGPEPQELMALKVPAVIIPCADASHATSAARYLQEYLVGSVYHDVPVDEQTPDRVRQWIIEFIETNASVTA